MTSTLQIYGPNDVLHLTTAEQKTEHLVFMAKDISSLGLSGRCWAIANVHQTGTLSLSLVCRPF